MPNSSGSVLALAASLRQLDEERLGRLIRRRRVRETGVNDAFDLAERLLDPPSVRAALAHLDRRSLLTLAVLCAAAAPGTPVGRAALAERIAAVDRAGTPFPATLEARCGLLAELGLVVQRDDGCSVLSPVAEQTAALAAHGLGLAELAGPVPAAITDDDRPEQARVDAAAAEQALAVAIRTGDLLAELAAEPAHPIARGGVAAPDIRRLAAASGFAARQTTVAFGICRGTGLVTAEAGQYRPGPDALAWLALPAPERWARLTGRWLARVPEDVTFFLADAIPAVWGPRIVDYLHWFYPAADEEVRALQDESLEAAELLGVLALRCVSTPALHAFRGDEAATAASIRERLPPEVDRVYVQNDLTVIAPGPLTAQAHDRLRRFALVEGRGLASSYRITDDSVAAALAAGETAESVLAALEELSLTGVPQPVRYLVGQQAARHGLVRVGPVIEGAPPEQPPVPRLSYLRSEDAGLVQAILVDRRLAPLGLHPEGEDRASCRFERDVLFHALAEARYPVTLEDQDGRLLPPPRPGRPPVSAAAAAGVGGGGHPPPVPAPGAMRPAGVSSMVS
ncbi:MAG: helicase-associated domain-containing protein, partial [Microbacteriaceae bacterium]